MTKTLLYISYGAGLHQQEIIFSLLSAWRWNPPDHGGIRYVVYTDQPAAFNGIPVILENVSADQWTEWSGPHRFFHRCKIMALQHTFQKFESPTVLLDGDTWFRKEPEQLFDRVAPGQSIMHLREGKLADMAFAIPKQMTELLQREKFIDRAGAEIAVSPSAAIWNAGVVGMDPSDLGLLNDVLDLTDQLRAKSDLHILEQFAFSQVLEQKSRLREADDIVFHYWPPYLHQPFQQVLPDIMTRSAAMPLNMRARYCYKQRPRPTLPRKGKVVLKHGMKALGMLKGGAKSNEW